MEGFWNRVQKSEGCWEWQGAINDRGYGRVWAFGKMERAHRVAYVLEYGRIPDDRIICHHCDNPACVRPDHLFVGTDKDNSDDKWEKGRGWALTGEIHPSSKLSESQVRAIREEYRKGGVTQRELASAYGVSRQQISRIARGVHWAQTR